MKLKDKDFKEWRTGFHAANPAQAQALVQIIDDLAAKLKEKEELLNKLTRTSSEVSTNDTIIFTNSTFISNNE